MLNNLFWRGAFRLGLASLCISAGLIAYGQGFSGGMMRTKMDVILKRKKPPQVYIIGDAISVQARSRVSKGAQHCTAMASMLESALINQNRRLRPEPANPETIISLDITQIESNEKWEERRSKQQKKTGERQVWNEKKKAYDKKDVYEEVEVRENYKVVNGSMTVSYQVKDVKTTASLDSDNIPAVFSLPYLDGNGAPALSEVENLLVRQVVNKIVPRLVPTEEPVKVLLAQGKLKDIAKFGEAQLWQKMIEGFEAMTPLKDPKDDSYRLYNLAVGYEAQAYKAEDLATTRKLLDKASILFNHAIEGKPDEKYYREPQLRIEQAITQYRKLEEQVAVYTKAKELKQTGGGDKGEVRPPIKDPPIKDRPKENLPLTNRDIIDLAGKNMDEANLIATINEAKSVKFDLTPQSLGDLLQNKVSNRVIAAMRAKQAGRKTTSTGTTKKKKGKGETND
jgi:hypothetical protein